MTSTQRSASSAAWPLPNDYGLELECADILEHQMYNQQVETGLAGIRCRSQKMKQETEVTTKELEILQTEICAI